jgi:hypothetical protein
MQIKVFCLLVRRPNNGEVFTNFYKKKPATAITVIIVTITIDSLKETVVTFKYAFKLLKRSNTEDAAEMESIIIFRHQSSI